ncbi:MAG TPA: sterol desaturase family protein [Terriglobales bacterium]|nr:sterol desaturase family protein [Terriglobales bacterium]
MKSVEELQQNAVRHGLRKKRQNALVALFSGILPAIFLASHFQPNTLHWIVGISIGLLWGNAFEYAYHRWLLHRPRSTFGKGHLEHHKNIGTPEEAEHVSLGRRPVDISLLFLSNGILVVASDLLLKMSISPGIFTGWTIYLIAAEEIHWRIHMQGWLPPGLRFSRAYHMSHHDIPTARFNVFLPVFDFLLGNSTLSAPRNSLQPH